MKEIPDVLDAAVNSLHGTETSPKEIVAEPIARGAIVGEIFRTPGADVNDPGTMGVPDTALG